MRRGKQLQDDYFSHGDRVFVQYYKLLKRSNDIYRRFEATDILINEQTSNTAGRMIENYYLCTHD